MAEICCTKTPIGEDQAVEMIDRFGYPDGFFTAGDTLGERSEFGEAVKDQPDTRADRRQAGHAEELMEQLPLEERHVLREEVDRLSIVAWNMVGHSQVVIGHDLESGIPEAHPDGQGALAGGDGVLPITLP